jgi:hypothetical protein
MSDGNGSGPRGYLLFVWSPTGYSLREREGDVPRVGDELEEDGRNLVVSKVGASPYPGDVRACVYSNGS